MLAIEEELSDDTFVRLSVGKDGVARGEGNAHLGSTLRVGAGDEQDGFGLRVGDFEDAVTAGAANGFLFHLLQSQLRWVL